MKESIIITLSLFILGVFTSRYNSDSINSQVLDNQGKGYEIKGDSIYFTYLSWQKTSKVYVIGNFMNWQKNHPDWEMKFDAQRNNWFLTIPIHKLRQSRTNFYEFTFFVNNQYVDAPSTAPNAIHCAGYGYRYLIPELNN